MTPHGWLAFWIASAIVHSLLAVATWSQPTVALNIVLIGVSVFWIVRNAQRTRGVS